MYFILSLWWVWRQKGQWLEAINWTDAVIKSYHDAFHLQSHHKRKIAWAPQNIDVAWRPFFPLLGSESSLFPFEFMTEVMKTWTLISLQHLNLGIGFLAMHCFYSDPSRLKYFAGLIDFNRTWFLCWEFSVSIWGVVCSRRPTAWPPRGTYRGKHQ